MPFERRLTVRDGHPLAPLIEQSDMLSVTARGAIVCKDMIDVPVDEHGIPRRSEFIKQVLGTVAAGYIWTGIHDVHHIAWPGIEYRKLGRIGAAYRGAGMLKVVVQRQLHEYTHVISSPPPKPPLDSIRQFALEFKQVERLYDTIKVSSYKNIDGIHELPFEEQEQLRQYSFERKLEQASPGEIGVMPDIEYLSTLHVSEARPILRKICRKQGISNAPSAKKRFFALDSEIQSFSRGGRDRDAA